MPVDIVDVSTWDTATRPAGSDVRTASSVQAPFQALANRTRWLKDRLASFIPESGGNADEYIYPVTKSRTRVFGVETFVPENPGNWTRSRGAWSPTVDAQTGWLYLPGLPVGASVTQVDVMVQSAASRATATDRWRCELYKLALDFGVPSATGTSIGAVANPTPAAAAVQLVSWVVGEFIDATEDLVIQVRGPIGSLGAADVVLGARVHFHDPGPRNY